MEFEDKKRTIIYVDKSDFKTSYKELMNSYYFKDQRNIDLFTCAALVGLYVVEEPLKLDNSNKQDYVRVNDNKNKDSMIILKSLAISAFGDVNVLTDEDKLFSYCEGYANSGIKQLYEWFKDPNYDFDTTLTKVLLEHLKSVDLEKLE